MKKNYSSIYTILLLFVLLLSITTYAQEEKNKSLTTGGASYVDSLNPGQYSTFEINYKVNSNLFLEIRGDLRTYGIIEVFKTPILAKQYVSDRFYIFYGVEAELTRDFLPGAEQILPQFKLKNGFGYDVNPYFTIEAKQDLNFSKNNFGPYANPNMFSLKGKLKF